MKYPLLTIETLNMQNQNKKDDNNLNRSTILTKYINKKKNYILGTQELNTRLSNKLIKSLDHYVLYGNFRFGKIKLLSDFNENNAIITDRKVVKTITKRLPWIPFNPNEFIKGYKKKSIIPRIVTISFIDDDTIGKLYVINTHLDYYLESIQKKQLNKIYQIVKKLSPRFPTILTGDFNMEIGTPHFDQFIANLNNIGLKRVNVNKKTNDKKYRNQTAIDHIFIPFSWEIKHCGIIKNRLLNKITDHKGVYVKVKIKKSTK